MKSRLKLLALPYVHEKNGRLYVRVNYPVGGGKWRSKERALSDDARPEDAITIVAELKAKLSQSSGQIDGDRLSFDQLLTEYRRAHPAVRDWYIDPLAFFAGRKLKSLTYADCKRFRESREAIKRADGQPRKPATINRELEVLRGVLLFAVRHGWLQLSPFSAGPALIHKSDEEQRDRLPTPEEEAQLLAVCIPPRAHLRGLIIATRDTGLRRSALLALDWSMLDWESRLLKVPRGKRQKQRPRVVGLTTRLYDELRAMWLAREMPTAGRIFDQAKDFKRSYRTACKLAGVVGLRFNDLRHGFATDLMEANIPERMAMKAAGHRNVETHHIYTNIDPRLARELADALDALHQRRTPPELATETIQ